MNPGIPSKMLDAAAKTKPFFKHCFPWQVNFQEGTPYLRTPLHLAVGALCLS